MALAAVQAMLARLFTDPSFRASFFSNPLAVGRAGGLEPTEARALAELSRQEVEHFAATLRRKRVGDVGKVLPLTARALGSVFGDQVLSTINGAARPGHHRDDARAVAKRLEHMARAHELEPPWAADLARYEAAFVEAWRPHPRLLIRRFRFPVAAVATAILRGAATDDIKPRTAIGVWLRWPGRRGVFHRIW